MLPLKCCLEVLMPQEEMFLMTESCLVFDKGLLQPCIDFQYFLSLIKIPLPLAERLNSEDSAKCFMKSNSSWQAFL